nr:Fur family transcriptional regulator [Naumannella halotolerans]
MDTAAILRDAGLRVTGPRAAVLQVLHDQPHQSVDEILATVRSRTAVSTQAVYDVLRVLHGARLVRRVEPAGSPARYELQTEDNHHHLVCRGCGTIVDLDCEIGTAPCLGPEQTPGFVIDEAEVTFWGWCADCAADRAAAVG